MSENNTIFLFSKWWDILTLLINSESKADVENGLYSLIEMFKRTNNKKIRDKSNELYGLIIAKIVIISRAIDGTTRFFLYLYGTVIDHLYNY